MPDIYQDDKGEFVVTLTDPKPKVVMDRSKLSEYGDVDLASGYKSNEIWTTKDGRRIAIPNLTDPHLLNIIDFIKKRVKQYRMQLAVKFLTRATVANMMFDHIPDWEMDEYHEDVRKQLKKFEKMPDEEFLRTIFPIYGKLYQEAYRRKLLIDHNPTPLKTKPALAPKKPERKKSLVEQMQELMKACRDYDGIEVPKYQWDIADAIVSKYPNDFKLGNARGPERAWKRLIPIGETNE